MSGPSNRAAARFLGLLLLLTPLVGGIRLLAERELPVPQPEVITQIVEVPKTIYIQIPIPFMSGEEPALSGSASVTRGRGAEEPFNAPPISATVTGSAPAATAAARDEGDPPRTAGGPAVSGGGWSQYARPWQPGVIPREQATTPPAPPTSAQNHPEVTPVMPDRDRQPEPDQESFQAASASDTQRLELAGAVKGSAKNSENDRDRGQGKGKSKDDNDNDNRDRASGKKSNASDGKSGNSAATAASSGKDQPQKPSGGKKGARDVSSTSSKNDAESRDASKQRNGDARDDRDSKQNNQKDSRGRRDARDE